MTTWCSASTAELIGTESFSLEGVSNTVQSTRQSDPWDTGYSITKVRWRAKQGESRQLLNCFPGARTFASNRNKNKQPVITQ